MNGGVVALGTMSVGGSAMKSGFSINSSKLAIKAAAISGAN